MQTATLSTYDQIKLEGKLEGIREQITAFAKKLIVELPSFSDQQIAGLTGATLKEVKDLRAQIATNNAVNKQKTTTRTNPKKKPSH